LLAGPVALAGRAARKQFCRRKPSLGEFIRCERIASNKNLLFRSVALTLRSLINDFIVRSVAFLRRT
jgi:hypothetical protein